MDPIKRTMIYPREFDSPLYQFMGKSHTPIYKFTPYVKSWILRHFPDTTHIRLKKFCGHNQKQQLWIGCWKNPQNEMSKPLFSHIFYTNEPC